MKFFQVSTDTECSFSPVQSPGGWTLASPPPPLVHDHVSLAVLYFTMFNIKCRVYIQFFTFPLRSHQSIDEINQEMLCDCLHANTQKLMPNHLWKCLVQLRRSERGLDDLNFPVLFLKLEAVNYHCFTPLPLNFVLN